MSPFLLKKNAGPRYSSPSGGWDRCLRWCTARPEDQPDAQVLMLRDCTLPRRGLDNAAPAGGTPLAGSARVTPGACDKHRPERAKQSSSGQRPEKDSITPPEGMRGHRNRRPFFVTPFQSAGRVARAFVLFPGRCPGLGCCGPVGAAQSATSKLARRVSTIHIREVSGHERVVSTILALDFFADRRVPSA